MLGFYYDRQLADKIITCCLYPNKKFSGDIDGKKDKWDPVDSSEPSEDSWGETKFPYSTKAIVTSVINEDFQVSIANTWGDAGGDPIGSMWNTFKPLAPYVSKVGDFLKDIGTKGKEWLDDKSKSGTVDRDSGFGKILNNFNDIAGKIGKQMDSNGGISKYLQRSLVVQGTRFQYYGGTGVDFGTLSLKFTLFPRWNDGEFYTIPEQLKDTILPYCIGGFEGVLENPEAGSIGELVNQYISWQLPPGGFEPFEKDVDCVQPGTLKLVIGGFYAIENLVIQSVQFNFSKEMAKTPKSGVVDYTPLYCEVVLNLKPVTKNSREGLWRFVSGKATKKARTDFMAELTNPLEESAGDKGAPLDPQPDHSEDANDKLNALYGKKELIDDIGRYKEEYYEFYGKRGPI